MTESKPVKLEDIIEGMDFQSEELQPFFNKKTGEVIKFLSEEISAAEDDESVEDLPEWYREKINMAKDMLESPDDYVPLPSSFEIHEYSIIERFCHTIKDDRIRDKMFFAIRGSGAFRMFKYNIREYGLEQAWYSYREKAFREIAIDWCKTNDIKFTEK